MDSKYFLKFKHICTHKVTAKIPRIVGFSDSANNETAVLRYLDIDSGTSL